MVDSHIIMPSVIVLAGIENHMSSHDVNDQLSFLSHFKRASADTRKSFFKGFP